MTFMAEHWFGGIKRRNPSSALFEHGRLSRHLTKSRTHRLSTWGQERGLCSSFQRTWGIIIKLIPRNYDITPEPAIE